MKLKETYKTVEEITKAFIKDGWSKDTSFAEVSPELANKIGSHSIERNIANGHKYFIMNRSNNIFDEKGEVAMYDIGGFIAKCRAEAKVMENTKINFDKEIDFKALCPELFWELATFWVFETFADDLHEQKDCLLSVAEVDGLCDEDKAKYVADNLSYDTDRMEMVIFEICDLKDIFDTAIKDPAFLEVVKQYCEHEEVNLNHFINSHGNLDYNEFLMHTDIRDIVLVPFCKQIINSDFVQEGMEKQLSELVAHYEELAEPAPAPAFDDEER